MERKVSPQGKRPLRWASIRESTQGKEDGGGVRDKSVLQALVSSILCVSNCPVAFSHEPFHVTALES